jgi:hypothetical protein
LAVSVPSSSSGQLRFLWVITKRTVRLQKLYPILFVKGNRISRMTKYEYIQHNDILLYYHKLYKIIVSRVAQLVLQLTTCWTVRDRIPVGTRLSARPDGPWGPPSLLYNGYQLFPGGKVRPGRAADHSPPSNAAVMEE